MKPGKLQWVVTFLMLLLFSASTTALCCVPAPSGLIGWWSAEGNADDNIGGNNGTLVDGVSFPNGKVGQPSPWTTQGATCPWTTTHMGNVISELVKPR